MGEREYHAICETPWIGLSIYHITVWEIDAGGMAREGAGGGRRERERDHYKGKESECQVNWIL